VWKKCKKKEENRRKKKRKKTGAKTSIITLLRTGTYTSA